MKLDIKTKYNASIEMHIHQGDVQWSRYNAMLVINTIFIGLIGFTYSEEFFIVIRQTMPVLGIMLCFLWFQMTKRGYMWITFWATQAREIEEDKRYNNKEEINPLIRGNELRKLNDEPFNTRNSSYIIIGIFTIIYSFILFNTISN